MQSVFVTPVWTCLKQLGLMTRFPSAEEWRYLFTTKLKLPFTLWTETKGPS